MRYIKYYDLGINEDDVLLFSKKFNIEEEVIRIIINRGYNTEEKLCDFLYPEKIKLQSPFLMKGMKEAVEIIKNSLANNENILIFGDYDVDGISATAIMVKCFEKMGKKVNYFLPNRYVDGYGLSCDVIKKIKDRFNPNLIITVDCGITAYEEVEFAKSLGIKVIVTDHHEIPEKLPDTVVINTKIQEQEYSFRGLCGTGVALKLAQALLGEENCEEFLPICAIATIADIVPLKDENRTLIRLGFQHMNKLPDGVKQLFSLNKVSLTKPDASDIAFKIAPKINASGRMGDAQDSLLLYFEKEPNKIKFQIEKILEHNKKRQELGSLVYKDCKKMLAEKDITNMPAIILWNENWDHGILGIECSRILEEFHRPVFLFTREGDVLKGSARSINDVNIHNILSSVSDILEVFGGHTMAAGLTLKLSNFDEFVNRVNSYIYEKINFKVFEPIEYYDNNLSLNQITTKLVQDLKVLEPCGADNPKPKFILETDKINIQPLSKASGHANIIIGNNLSLIFFNYIKEASKLNFGSKFRFVFEIQDVKSKYVKGTVKDFDFDNRVKNSSSKYLECYVLNQLQYTNKDEYKYKTYNESDMLKFVLDCSNNIFGTVFVANTLESYNNFIKTYDLSSIYDINIVDPSSAGFNSVLLAPKDVNFAKKYNKVVFLDPVLDMAYIGAINECSNAQIYIPNFGKNSKTLLDNLKLDRKHFANIYKELLKFQNLEFVSLLSVYSQIVKTNKVRISFNNFYVPFCVFTQLGIVQINEESSAFKYSVSNSMKSNLGNSSIYNTLNLLKKV